MVLGAIFATLWFCSSVQRASGDVPLPRSILEPATEAEAWNVIGLATRNVKKLIEESRLPEIPQQISLCSPALRTLARRAGKASPSEAVVKETSQLQEWVNAVAKSATEDDRTSTESGFRMLENLLKELGQHYDAGTVKADIFLCSMHPDFMGAMHSFQVRTG